MHDHDRRHVRDLAMPFGAGLWTFAARDVISHGLGCNDVEIRRFHPFRRRRQTMHGSAVQNRRVHRIERIFELLHIIALAHVAGKLTLAIVAREKMIVRQHGRLSRSHVRPDHAAQFARGICFQRNLVFEITARRLAGLLQAASVHVEHPAVITTANPASLDPTVVERSAPVRASRLGQTDAAKLVAKQQQILAEPAYELGRFRVDFTRQPDRQPIFAQRFARRRARCDSSEQFIFSMIHMSTSLEWQPSHTVFEKFCQKRLIANFNL